MSTGIDKIIEFNVTEEDAGLRADVVISKYLKDYTRSFIKNNLKELVVNNKSAKLSSKLNLNDKVYYSYNLENRMNDIKPEDIKLNIVYEDENYIIINKPYGMVVHPAKGNYEGTLVNALLHYTNKLSDINGDVVRPGIVHRIDKETTGLIVVAKNNKSHAYMVDLFKSRDIIKKYKAIVKGYFTPSHLVIENMIGRSPTNRKKMSVVNNGGKNSITVIDVIKHYDDYTLLDVQIKTGRTHQIRVHTSYLGHPIIGDLIYSRNNGKYRSEKLCLCAYKISFFDKFTNRNMKFEIEPPDYFNKYLQ